jgi:hypothetical protein
MKLSNIVYWCNAALSIALMLVLLKFEPRPGVTAIIFYVATFVSFVLGAVWASFRSEEV